MKRVALVLIGMTAAGFLSVGLVRAADDEPDLGESVVVSPSPGVSVGGVRPFTAPTSKAEPVKPPAPKPGGRDDDDGNDRARHHGDDDDGGDDDDD